MRRRVYGKIVIWEGREDGGGGYKFDGGAAGGGDGDLILYSGVFEAVSWL